MSFGTASFHVQIAPACSGYEGIGLILAFTAAWLWFFRPGSALPASAVADPGRRGGHLDF